MSIKFSNKKPHIHHIDPESEIQELIDEFNKIIQEEKKPKWRKIVQKPRDKLK